MKIVLSIIISLLFINNIAMAGSNFDTLVELARHKKVDNIVIKINKLAQYTKQYILNSGDLTPTLEEINSYFGIKDPDVWKNYDGDRLLSVKLYDSNIVISNIFSNKPNKNIKSMFLTNRNHLSTVILDKNDISTVKFRFDSKLWDFINIIKDIDKNVIISTTEPTQYDKLWYRPNGDGGFAIYKYSGDKWILVKTLLTEKSVEKTKLDNIVSSIEELDRLPKIDGYLAIVSDGKHGIEYIYDEDSSRWIQLNSAKHSGMVSDIIEHIDPLLDRDSEMKYFHSHEQSIVKILTLLNNNIVKFERYKKFWLAKNVKLINYMSRDGIKINANIYVAESLDDLPNSDIPKGSVAYLLENNEIGNYKGDDDFPELYFDGVKWIYMVPDLDSLLTYVDPRKSNSTKYFVYSQQSFFYYTKVAGSRYGEWYSPDKHIRITKGSRRDLSYGVKGWSYYSLKLCSNDEICSKDNREEPRYSDSGVLSDIKASNRVGKFYKWIVVNSDPKAVHRLIDKYNKFGVNCIKGNSNQVGQLFDEDGNVLSGVDIYINGCHTTSDKDGKYRFDNIKYFSKVYIKFEKDGYVTNEIPISIFDKIDGEFGVKPTNYIELSLKKFKILNFKDNDLDYENNSSKLHISKYALNNNNVKLKYFSDNINLFENNMDFISEFYMMDKKGKKHPFKAYSYLVINPIDNNILLNSNINVTFKNVDYSNPKLYLLKYDFNRHIWIFKGYAYKDKNGYYNASIDSFGTWSIVEPIFIELGHFAGDIQYTDKTPTRAARVYALGKHWRFYDLSTDRKGHFQVDVAPDEGFVLYAVDFKKSFDAKYAGKPYPLPGVGSGKLRNSRY